MSASASPVCEWSGRKTDPDDRITTCGHPAAGYVISAAGRRIHVCEDHVAWAKKLGRSGVYVRRQWLMSEEPPPTRRTVTRQDRRAKRSRGRLVENRSSVR